jgi:hypothetical protein
MYVYIFLYCPKVNAELVAAHAEGKAHAGEKIQSCPNWSKHICLNL